MANSAEAWLIRAKMIVGGDTSSSEAVQFAVSFLTATYGPESSQLKAFTMSLQQMSRLAPTPGNAAHHQRTEAIGAIQNTIAEIEGSLITSLRQQVAGEIFEDLIRLGKETLSDATDSSKNVGAVLAAAAFEDIIRRMGAELAGVVDRPRLEEVVTALKTAGILKGGEIGTAQSYLKFRNDSLHADWANVQSHKSNPA